MYPYNRAINGLDACLPLWVRDGGTDAMIARLKDPSQRDRIKREMEDPDPRGWENQWYGIGRRRRRAAFVGAERVAAQ